MKYVSSRGGGERISASLATVRGLATDGGLYVPESVPAITTAEIGELCALDYRGRALRIMSPFLEEYSREELESLITASYGENFDCPQAAPTRIYDGSTAFLELWHGPTCAFKDMALQIMPRMLVSSLRKNGEQRQVCILVATSGDTGKAALEGFRDVPGTRILVFYPRDGVSDVQKLQMTTQEGANVCVSSVEGNFDDAQTGVKTIFGDRDFAKRLDERGFFLSSANSINWGRLLPQLVYYFSAYCDMVNAGNIALGEELVFCVPTGNFGDILAGWYAKQMGLPVKKLLCASNENNVLTDFIATGVYDKNRPFHVTTSPSMDILVSSNLERLLYNLSGDGERVRGYMSQLSQSGRYDVGPELLAAVRREFECGFADVDAAAEEIARLWSEQRYLIDPHTAVASRVLRGWRERTGDGTAAVIVSTASPFKFSDSVLRALGQSAEEPGTALLSRLSALTGEPVPAPLAGLAGRPERFGGCVEKSAMLSLVDSFLS